MGREIRTGKIPFDEYVWNMVMSNGYDCVFGVNIDDHSIDFYHVYERKNQGSAYAKIDSLNVVPQTLEEFLGYLEEYVVDEEQDVYREQLQVD